MELRPKNGTSNGPPTAQDLAELKPIRVSVENIDLTPDLVQKYIAKGATKDDLFWFMGTARSLGLNPLLNEIHWVPFAGGGKAVVGYTVYLKRAEMSGQLDGWSTDYGKDDMGEYCEITIHRKDRSHPFVWKTYREEVDTGSPIWKKRGHFMHAKCTIAQAMRLCFPVEVGSLPYIMEEIVGEPEGAPTPIQQPAPTAEPPKIQAQTAEYVEERDPGQPIQPQEEQPRDGMSEHRKAWQATVKNIFKTEGERHAWQAVTTGKPSTKDWIATDYTKAFDALNKALSVAGKPTEETPAKEVVAELDTDTLITRVAKKLSVDDAAFGGWISTYYQDIDVADKELARALEHDSIALAMFDKFQATLKPKAPGPENGASNNKKDLFEGDKQP